MSIRLRIASILHGWAYRLNPECGGMWDLSSADGSLRVIVENCEDAGFFSASKGCQVVHVDSVLADYGDPGPGWWEFENGRMVEL